MNPENDEQISRLYQQIEKESPSELLDARIRQAARKQAPGRRKSRLLGWLSTAALLVLSVGLVLRVMQETPVKQEFAEQADFRLQQSEPAPPVPPASSASRALPKKAPAGMSLGQPQQEAAMSRADREIMLDAVVSEKKTMSLEPAAEPANWCGQADLEQQKDKAIWLKRVQQLREQDNEAMAQCLETLMIEMVKADRLQ